MVWSRDENSYLSLAFITSIWLFVVFNARSKILRQLMNRSVSCSVQTLARATPVIPDGIEFIRYRRFYSFLFPPFWSESENLYFPAFPRFWLVGAYGLLVALWLPSGLVAPFWPYGFLVASWLPYGLFPLERWATSVLRHLPLISNTSYSIFFFSSFLIFFVFFFFNYYLINLKKKNPFPSGRYEERILFYSVGTACCCIDKLRLLHKHKFFTVDLWLN